MKVKENTFKVIKYKPRQLSAYVENFMVYHFKGKKPVLLYPEGHFELIFQVYGNFSQNNINSTLWDARPVFFIGGLHNTSYAIKPEEGQSKLISVEFKPGSARFFIPEKLNLFKNRVVDLKDVFRSSKIDNIEAILWTDNTKAQLEMIETFLVKIFIQKTNSPIDIALSKIIQHSGFVSIDALARISCLSNSQFRKRFNEEVGMSPKEYSKIVRAKCIARILLNNPHTSLTELTYKLGYFDQAHFIKDFKSVVGTSPGQFQKLY
ncbi:MAG: helix-turn-helix domain-containing protein [Bacteroidales bacterium]|nr:helix-turn-helix domain-containing protein [Bacteroidales bacterium]MCF8402346.1 helix-turn-helix domain-containing protein [Bacteroidales bacterium]